MPRLSTSGYTTKLFTAGKIFVHEAVLTGGLSTNGSRRDNRLFAPERRDVGVAPRTVEPIESRDTESQTASRPWHPAIDTSDTVKRRCQFSPGLRQAS